MRIMYKSKYELTESEERMLQKKLGDDASNSSGIFIDNVLVGAVEYYIESDEMIIIEYLSILEEHRGKGYGSQIISNLRELCKDPDMVVSCDLKDIGFWIKLGAQFEFTVGTNYTSSISYKTITEGSKDVLLQFDVQSRNMKIKPIDKKFDMLSYIDSNKPNHFFKELDTTISRMERFENSRLNSKFRLNNSSQKEVSGHKAESDRLKALKKVRDDILSNNTLMTILPIYNYVEDLKESLEESNRLAELLEVENKYLNKYLEEYIEEFGKSSKQLERESENKVCISDIEELEQDGAFYDDSDVRL